jgi:GIY-YIG catalytic domain
MEELEKSHKSAVLTGVSRTRVQEKPYVVYLSGPCPKGKFYVGQTADFSRRCRDHKIAAGGCPQFHAAIKTFGWEHLEPGIIAQTDIAEEADRLEKLFIARFNSLFPHGYNLTTGGRSAAFDPRARISSFEEAFVSEKEIILEGKKRQETHFCQTCGETSYQAICPRCGVHEHFARVCLQQLVDGGSPESFAIPGSPKIVKSFRASRDVEFLIGIQKSRLSTRRTDDVLPTVASEYFGRLLPYVRQSLKRDVLVGKKLPCFTLGSFRGYAGSKLNATTVIAVERMLRRRRSELGLNSLSNIEVFTEVLRYYGRNKAKEAVSIETLRGRGASEQEIMEALEDAALHRQIEEMHSKELAQLFCGKNCSSAFAATESGLIINLSYVRSPEEEQIYRENLLPNNLGHMGVVGDKPALHVNHEGIFPPKTIIFGSLTSRRQFISHALTLSLEKRREFVAGISEKADGILTIKGSSWEPKSENRGLASDSLEESRKLAPNSY